MAEIDSTTPGEQRGAPGGVGASRLLLWGFPALLALTMLAYSPLREAGFTSWDDPSWIGANPALSPPSLRGLASLWLDPFDGSSGVFGNLYAPLTHTVWYLVVVVARADGVVSEGIALDPGAFHLLSVATHLVAVTFAFLLARQIFDSRAAPALAAAAVLALHPLAVESVAWVSGYKDVLCGALSLASLWWFARTAKRATRPSPGRSLIAFAPAVVLAGLAMLAKPSAVTLPLLAAAICVTLPGGRYRTLVVPLALSVLLALPVVGVTLRFQQPAGSNDPAPVHLRPLVAADAVGFYAAKTIFPRDLAIDYSRTAGRTTRDLRWLPHALLAAVLLGGIVLSRDRVLLAGAALFVTPLLPVLGLVEFDFAVLSVVADHYAYVSLVGAGVVVARVGQLAAGRLGVSEGMLGGTCVLTAVVLAGLTFAQARAWTDSTSLYVHSMSAVPRSVIPHANLAATLLARGDLDAALRYANTALEVYPGHAQSHLVVAMVRTRTGDPRTALKHLVAAGKVLGRRPEYQVEVAEAYLALGRSDRAVSHASEALRLDPKHAAAAAVLSRARSALAASQPATTPSTHPSQVP